jgi:hypothetical protein
MKTIMKYLMNASFLIGLGVSARASVIMAGSVANQPLSYCANLSISGDTLTLVLTNTSSQASQVKSDCLSSFYFDILKGTNRPTMTLTGATGSIYLTSVSSPDALQADTNLVGAGTNGKWQFKNMNAAQKPFKGFGIGTVGNNSEGDIPSANTFFGNLVGGIDYSIYVGDATTNSLKNYKLVHDSATFTFKGLTGYSENDIVRTSYFGLGTGPDAMVLGSGPTPGPVPAAVPTPSAAASGLALLAGLGFMAIRRKMAHQ